MGSRGTAVSPHPCLPQDPGCRGCSSWGSLSPSADPVPAPQGFPCQSDDGLWHAPRAVASLSNIGMWRQQARESAWRGGGTAGEEGEDGEDGALGSRLWDEELREESQNQQIHE